MPSIAEWLLILSAKAVIESDSEGASEILHLSHFDIFGVAR